MSGWQEKAREALTVVWEADCLCGADGCQTEEQAILTAVAPVVEAEMRRAVSAERASVRALIDDLHDPDECWYDHHGHCQAHGWPEVDPPCPDRRAKEWLTTERLAAIEAEAGESRG